MTQYEVTFIVDPVLSGDESKSTAKVYQDLIADKGGSIVNVDNIGLRSLAYAINKRTTGVYYCVEFQAPGDALGDVELAMQRDERIMRFLTVKLDKYGVKYNDDKRNGLIGRKREQVSEEMSEVKATSDTLRATGPAPARSSNVPPAPVREEPLKVVTAEDIPPPRPVEAMEINTGTDTIDPDETQPAPLDGPASLAQDDKAIVKDGDAS